MNETNIVVLEPKKNSKEIFVSMPTVEALMKDAMNRGIKAAKEPVEDMVTPFVPENNEIEVKDQLINPISPSDVAPVAAINIEPAPVIDQPQNIAPIPEAVLEPEVAPIVNEPIQAVNEPVIESNTEETVVVPVDEPAISEETSVEIEQNEPIAENDLINDKAKEATKQFMASVKNYSDILTEQLTLAAKEQIENEKKIASDLLEQARGIQEQNNKTMETIRDQKQELMDRENLFNAQKADVEQRLLDQMANPQSVAGSSVEEQSKGPILNLTPQNAVSQDNTIQFPQQPSQTEEAVIPQQVA